MMMMVLTTALPEISEDLLIEILIKLPAKSLMRLKRVSKIWLSLISCRYLANRFLKPFPRQRFLAYFRSSERHALFRSSDHDHSDTLVSVIEKYMDIGTIGGGRLVGSVRGLLCFRSGRRVRVSNPMTRQVVELPVMEAGDASNENLLFFFGHDPVNDEYKVLCTVWEVNNEEEKLVIRSEHQVLVLGAGASWKKAECHITHRPYRSCWLGVITINGVLYYTAWNDANECVVMSFNFSSQEFSLIELPVDAFIVWMNLTSRGIMNYKGKVSIFRALDFLSDGVLDVWVLEDAGKSQWSDRKTFVLPDFQRMNTINGDLLKMRGSNRSGELWLSKTNPSFRKVRPSTKFIYDVERNKIAQRIVTIPLEDDDFAFPRTGWGVSVIVFSHDIESIMYLET
ncbi:hypothetical protein CARUB_v10011569mg [Capsella rubella]|uniref:F-box domain-containing protein n=1 Tax=Capsella rubella TaxID=81985 RepID=R0I5A8_9BRAS|nr:putative F-box protein At3g52320 [Capsella rubella]EOA37459.1 hypothetical protein CARUB_v10011569mg [Capsella rubella]